MIQVHLITPTAVHCRVLTWRQCTDITQHLYHHDNHYHDHHHCLNHHLPKKGRTHAWRHWHRSFPPGLGPAVQVVWLSVPLFDYKFLCLIISSFVWLSAPLFDYQLLCLITSVSLEPGKVGRLDFGFPARQLWRLSSSKDCTVGSIFFINSS